MSLDRYYKAQETDYECARRELQNGRKQSHWMWYIFPQLKGMGYSETSRYYAIDSFQEATDYLKDPILGSRLIELSRILLEQKANDPIQIFGSIDAAKLRSCMTLFSLVAEDSRIFDSVLDKYFGGNRCPFTVEAYQNRPHSDHY